MYMCQTISDFIKSLEKALQTKKLLASTLYEDLVQVKSQNETGN